MKYSGTDDDSPTRSSSLSSSAHSRRTSVQNRNSLLGMGGLNKYIGTKSSAASAKKGFEEFEDTPSVQAHEDNFSIPDAAVDITKDFANSKLLERSKRVTDSTKISQLSGMGHLKSLAKATMKNIGKSIVEPSSQDEIKNQEGLSPQSDKKDEQKSAGINNSESKRSQDGAGKSSSSQKKELMARSSSQDASTVNKKNFRRSRSLDVDTKRGIKTSNNAGPKTPTGCERIPRRIKRNNTIDRSNITSSKSPSNMRRSSTMDRSNIASSKSPSSQRRSTTYRSNVISSRSPSLRRPTRHTPGATSPASGQSIRRHSVRSKAQIGNHQLRQVLREPQYVPNVLSKNLDDDDENFVSDPYGHDVDDDGESELLGDTAPKAIKKQHLPTVTTMGTTSVDPTTVDFTSLDSASVHQVLRTCEDELIKRDAMLSSVTYHGQTDLDRSRCRRQRRCSVSGAALANPSAGATSTTILPCGINPQRQRRRFSAGGFADQASSSLAPSKSLGGTAVSAALAGRPASRRQTRASTSGTTA